MQIGISRWHHSLQKSPCFTKCIFIYLNTWCYIELDTRHSAYILHTLQVPDVGDAVHSPQLPGDRRHVCLLLHCQCGVQRTV